MTPPVQKLAPNFTADALVGGSTFKKISLTDYLGKWVVLVFYPLDFTFVCPTELIAFDSQLEEFRKLGAEVIGISTDSEMSHFAWVNTPRKEGGLGKEFKLTLVADKTHAVAKQYGVLIEEEGIALRGLFIIDPKQTLRQVTVNDLPVGRSVDETIRLIKAFQFTDKHGEVCPANWTEGKKTMKADVVGSKEYFSTVN